METSLSNVLRRIRWMVVPYLIILIICLFIKLTFTRHQIYFAVNGFNNPVLDFFAPFVTDMGNGWTAVALAAIFSLFSYRKGFIIAIGYGITSLLAQVVKYIFIAPRPKLYFGQEIAHAHFVKGIYILSTYSFPSGHTVSAFTLAVIFSYWSRNKAWCPVFLLLAVMVGYSRMYLSEHFFEDVVAGSVLGLVLTVIWLYWIENRKFIHRPSWQKGLLSRKA